MQDRGFYTVEQAADTLDLTPGRIRQMLRAGEPKRTRENCSQRLAGTLTLDGTKEAGQRIRATQSLMRSEGMTEGENYRDLLTRLSTALAMTEAAYLEARPRRDL